MLYRTYHIDAFLTDEKSETSKKKSTRCFINRTVLHNNNNNQASHTSCNFVIFIVNQNSYLRIKKGIFDA